MSTSRTEAESTAPAFAVELLKQLKLEELTLEEAFKRFKKKHSIPILDIIHNFLNNGNDPESFFLFNIKTPFSDQDKKIMGDWAKNYFQDTLKMTDKEILDTTEFPGKTANQLFMLGIAYDWCFFDAHDPKIAFHFYQQSANKGSIVAVKSMAYKLSKGYGCEINIPKAREYYAHSFALSEIARNNMAMLLEAHFPEEHEESLRNYILSAIAMDNCGIDNLRICFRDQFCGLARDPMMEEKLAMAAIARGDRIRALSYSSQLPYEDRWQYVRLVATVDANYMLRTELKEKGKDAIPALTYHAAFALKESNDAKEVQELKKAFSELCDTKPDTVKKLMQELDDSEDDVLEMLMDDQQMNLLSLLCMYQQDSSFLILNTFNIVVRYLDLPVFASPFVLKREELARETMQFLLSKNSLLAKKKEAREAERGEITYQMAVRKVF